MNWRRRKGSSLVEFTLCGIPMIFVLMSIFDMSRIVWSYHTLTAAVTEAERFAIVHGSNCRKSPNDCAASVADVARRLHTKGVGLVPADTNISLISYAGTTKCQMPDCLKNTTPWPPAGANGPGQEIEISASYSMTSMIAMFWPGARTVGPWGRLQLYANSREVVQF